MSTVVKDAAVVLSKQPFIKRATGVLSDGSVAVCVVDENVSPGEGDDSGVAKIYIYHSTDRVTWTLKNTITPDAAIYGTALHPPVVAFCVASDDSIHLAYVRQSDRIIKYQKLAYTAGPTWTPGSVEQVKGNPGVTPYHVRIDMDIHPTLLVPLIGTIGLNGLTATYLLFQRRTSDNTWQQIASTNYWTTSTAYHADITVAWNATPNSGPSSRTHFAICFSQTTTSTDYGDAIRIFSVDTVAGSTATLQVNYLSNLNIGKGSRLRRNWLFSSGANEWTLVGVCGTTSSFTFAMRFTVTTGAVVTPSLVAYKGTVQKHLLKGFSNVWCAVAYSDDKFISVGTGVDGFPYVQSGSITRNLTGINTITFSTQNTQWDNAYKSSLTRYGLMYYAGNNNQINAGLNRLDTLYIDGPNTSTITSGVPQTYRHQYNYPNVAPTVVTPAAGASSETNSPPLTALIDYDINYPQAKVKVRWILATDAGFTANVRTVDEADSSFRYVLNTAIGVATTVAIKAIPTAQALFSGTWYVKAAYISEHGQVGAYSAATSFSVIHPPSSVAISPSGDQYLEYTDVAGFSPTVFNWTFTDPSITDHQSAYQIVIENALDSTSIVDTGKITSILNVATVSIPDTVKDMQLKWNVTVWDVDDTVGPPSDYQTFFVGDAPTVVIDSPASSEVIVTPNPVIAYSVTPILDRTIQSYRIIISEDLATDVIIFDSGWLPVSSIGPFTYALATPSLINLSSYIVDVYIRDNKNLQGEDQNLFTTSWTPPDAPIFTADESFYDPLGYIKITWTNNEMDLDFISYKVYRRTYDSVSLVAGIWTLLYETVENESNYEYLDWLALGNQGYQYVVVQVADRFEAEVESVYAPDYLLATTDKYWFLHPTDFSLNISVVVKEDSFTEEWEEEEFHVLGKGRHVDYGDRLGYTGSLSMQLRDDAVKTARQKRLEIQIFKTNRTPVYLRNPFGDMWLVNLKNLKFERQSGMGVHEAVNLDVEYIEIDP